MANAHWTAYFGDPEQALKIITTIESRGGLNIWEIWRSNYREMRKLDGFKDLLRKMGLVKYWRTTHNWGDFCRPVGISGV